MTLPNEWFISMRNTRKFLFDLLDRQQTKKVPKEIRERASRCLKHFPFDIEINELEKFYESAHKDKNVLIGELNKELNSINNEILIAQKRLNEVATAIQQLLNKS